MPSIIFFFVVMLMLSGCTTTPPGASGPFRALNPDRWQPASEDLRSVRPSAVPVESQRYKHSRQDTDACDDLLAAKMNGTAAPPRPGMGCVPDAGPRRFWSGLHIKNHEARFG